MHSILAFFFVWGALLNSILGAFFVLSLAWVHFSDFLAVWKWYWGNYYFKMLRGREQSTAYWWRVLSCDNIQHRGSRRSREPRHSMLSIKNHYVLLFPFGKFGCAFLNILLFRGDLTFNLFYVFRRWQFLWLDATLTLHVSN